jgi:hypothetical protein
MIWKLIDYGKSWTDTLDKWIGTPYEVVSCAHTEMNREEEYYGLLSYVWNGGVVLYIIAFGFLPLWRR